MKSTFFLLSLFFLFNACKPVYFTEPQPKGGTFLTEVPKELQGEWKKDEEIYILNDQGLIMHRTRIDSLENVKIVRTEKIPMSDSVYISRIENLYVLNYKESTNGWEFITVKKRKNGKLILYQLQSPEFFIKQEGLVLDHATFHLDDSLQDVKTLNPDFESSLIPVSTTFSGQLSYKSLKKMTRHKFRAIVFKTNGTMKDRKDRRN